MDALVKMDIVVASVGMAILLVTGYLLYPNIFNNTGVRGGLAGIVLGLGFVLLGWGLLHLVWDTIVEHESWR